jgi:hypothetical protein
MPFTLVVDGNDLVVNDSYASWWGGPNDPEDLGPTASRLVDLKKQPDFRGCSLPMAGFSAGGRLAGSPIPKLPWGTIVHVTSVDSGSSLDLPLIDLGPSPLTGSAISLTAAAFRALGGDFEKRRMRVSFRIVGGAKFLSSGLRRGDNQ